MSLPTRAPSPAWTAAGPDSPTGAKAEDSNRGMYYHHILTYFPPVRLCTRTGRRYTTILSVAGRGGGWADGRMDGLASSFSLFFCRLSSYLEAFWVCWNGREGRITHGIRDICMLPSTCVCPGDPRTDRRTDGRMDGRMEGRRTLIPNHDTRIARKEITPFFFFFFFFFLVFYFCYEPARKGYRLREEEERKNGGFCSGVALMDSTLGSLPALSSLLLFPRKGASSAFCQETVAIWRMEGSFIGPGCLSWGWLAGWFCMDKTPRDGGIGKHKHSIGFLGSGSHGQRDLGMACCISEDSVGATHTSGQGRAGSPSGIYPSTFSSSILFAASRHPPARFHQGIFSHSLSL
jgi:hypothetical protein